MKWHPALLLAFALLVSSCDPHAALNREIATLEAAVKADQETAKQHEENIAALGGLGIEDKLKQQTANVEKNIQAIEFDNAARDRKWSAIAAEFSQLKPAAETYKAAHLR